MSKARRLSRSLSILATALSAGIWANPASAAEKITELLFASDVFWLVFAANGSPFLLGSLKALRAVRATWFMF